MHPDSSRVLSATLHDTAVLVRYHLGVADGITVLCRRAQEEEFLMLAEDDESPVVDDRPKLHPDRPEIRIYRGILYYDDAETLRLTNEVRVVVP